MRKYLAILLPLALALAACQRETGGDPLKLTGKMFVFNYRLAYATYLVTLEQMAPLPDGTVVKAEFENPAGGAPLTLERRIFPNLPKVVLESPDVTCVKKARPYKVTIAVVGPDGGTLQSIETQVTSSADQSIRGWRRASDAASVRSPSTTCTSRPCRLRRSEPGRASTRT